MVSNQLTNTVSQWLLTTCILSFPHINICDNYNDYNNYDCTCTCNLDSLSIALNVSLGVPKGVFNLAKRQYWADSYVAQNHNNASQLPTYKYTCIIIPFSLYY